MQERLPYIDDYTDPGFAAGKAWAVELASFKMLDALEGDTAAFQAAFLRGALEALQEMNSQSYSLCRDAAA